MENESKPQSQTSLGLFGIVAESYKTTLRNWRLLLPILLCMFLSIYQFLDIAENYILGPVIDDLRLQLTKQPPMNISDAKQPPMNISDAKQPPINTSDLSYNLDQPTYRDALDNHLLEFLLLEFSILAFSSVLVLVFLVAIVSSSYEAYVAKPLAPKEMFQKIRTRWTKPIVTSFYMILITLGIICLKGISFIISSFCQENSWARLVFDFIPLLILVWGFYVAALGMLSLVVSVLEEGFVGVKAIGRAAELMSGKRLQAVVMMILFAISYLVVHQMEKAFRSYRLSRTWMAVIIPLTNELYYMLTVFMFVVFTVFYHDRKTSHEDQMEVKSLYLPIAAAEA